MTCTGASLSIQAKDIHLDTASCTIQTLDGSTAISKDVVWIRPTCVGDSCAMYLGDFSDSSNEVLNFSLTSDEINCINTSNIGTVYIYIWVIESMRIRILIHLWLIQRVLDTFTLMD